MGKRSSFERIERDFYPTPFAAVSPLIPHLRGVRSFAEPCCGDGALVRHLETFGLRCAYAGDISTGKDALALAVADCNGADGIITNPPYARELMHRLIEHFREIAPTWLLLPADWMHNLHAANFLPSCTDIVSVGRLRWVEGTKMSSMENFAWYRFHARHLAGPILHARASALVSLPVSRCAQCGGSYRPQRSDALFCSPACKQRAYRRRLISNAAVTRDGGFQAEKIEP